MSQRRAERRRRTWSMVVLTGCGASHHDAVAERPAFEVLLGAPAVARPASEPGICPADFFTKQHPP